ncbi:MAG: SDR family oxidoreductase [Ktedonobacterales bacterium]
MSATVNTPPHIAVVTGGGRGIGRAIARTLAAQGAHVLVGYHTSADAAQRLVSELQAQGHQATAQQVDVTRTEEVEALTEVAATLGGPHIWVNNAGASANSSETSGLSDEERWERVMQVDVRGCWLGCRAAAPRIRAAGGGVIVNIGWNHAYDGAPDGQGVVGQIYAASKASVLALTRSFAHEWAPQVRVNAVAPGWVENDWSATRSDAFRELVAQGVPLRRWGRAEDIAAAVAWLASPAAAYITGQTLIVDGGEVMR